MAKKLITRKVAGSTLLETLVALMLIVIGFSIGAQTFYTVTNSTRTSSFIRARWYTEEYIHQWEKHPATLPNEMILEDGLVLRSTNEPHPDHSGLYQLKIGVYDGNDDEIYSRKVLLIDENE